MMNFCSILLVFSLFLLLNVEGHKRDICVRREFRSLSPYERDRLISAMRKLNEGPRPTVLDKLTHKHVKYFPELHTGDGTLITEPVFLPWHRKFTLDFEEELQKIDSSLCLAYWAWSEDYHEGSSSAILSDRYFGGDGDKLTNCTRDGQFKHWKTYYDDDLQLDLQCLKREFTERGDLKLLSTDLINGVISNLKSFHSFTFDIEEIHNRFHFGFGGTMATPASTYDPIFWLHHAYIDKLWMDWQLKEYRRATDYSGDRNAVLQGYKETVDKYVDYRNMNYRYEDYKSDATILRNAWLKFNEKYNYMTNVPLAYKRLRRLPVVLSTLELDFPKARLVDAKIDRLIESFNYNRNYVPSHVFKTHPQLSQLLKWYQYEKINNNYVNFESLFRRPFA